MDDLISRQAAIDALGDGAMVNYQATGHNNGLVKAIDIIKGLPSAQPEWNNHKVACNYNGIDEWLPNKCELLDACPNPGGVACWEQYLKHRAEGRADGGD